MTGGAQTDYGLTANRMRAALLARSTLLGLASCALFLFTFVMVHDAYRKKPCEGVELKKPLRATDVGLHEACSRVFMPPDPHCLRFMRNNIGWIHGLGHQVAELLFGLQKARSQGLSYVFEPLMSSKSHSDNYTFVNDLLGLPQLFQSLGGVSIERVEDILANTTSSWTSSSDAHGRSSKGCNVFQEVGGYYHCTSVPDGNCFFSPENAYLYQNAAECLRKAASSYGTAFDRCIFQELLDMESTLATEHQSTPAQSTPNATIVAVWHVRVGDIVLHDADDPSYARVLSVLKEITEGHKLVVLLVGKWAGEDEKHGASRDYVESVSRLAAEAWAGSSQALRPQVMAPSFSVRDAFVAMMQADVLIGSGSSLPAAAALFSGVPLFFNHVGKYGYHFGAEMLADSVDMARNGTILDSPRRLKVDLHDRMRPGRRRACRYTM